MTAINITKEMFNENIIEGKKTSIVEFWAPWCTYCKRLGPTFDKTAEQYGEEMFVGKINVDEIPQMAEEFNVEVIPTIIAFKDGKLAGRIVAPDSKAKIDQFIKENI